MEHSALRRRLGTPLTCLLAISLVFILASCKPKGPQQMPQMPPPEVSVITVTPSPVTLTEEYVAQTEAKDEVEIRSRIGGILEKQAFEDGARVKKGQLLFVIDQQPYIVALAQAKASLAQANASLVNSRQNLARLKPLAEDQAISQQDLDAATAKELADAAVVEAGKAGVRQAELNLGYATITAPRDGVASKALVRPGSLVSANATLLTTIYSVDPIYATTTVSEQKLLQLNRMLGTGKGREAAHIKVILSDGAVYEHSAHINFMDAAINKQTGTLAVRVSMPNPKNLLLPGQFVRLVFPAIENPNAIRVPMQAVQEMQGIRSVLVVGKDGKAEPRTITSTARVDNDLIVDKGLAPGEVVIVEGTAKVKPGMAVKPVPMGAKPEGAPAKPASAKKAV
ncbi:MAG TPA: efflux RND transporter periplasmic adaptor subunit [Nitrospirota bacterium]